MAIKTIKTPDGEEFNIDEWLHWPLYSVIESGANLAVNYRLFSYVVGQRVPGSNTTAAGSRDATESDTNQVNRSRINHDEAFLCFCMTYEHFAVEGVATTGAPAQSNGSNMIFPVPPADAAAVAPILWGTNLRRLQRDVMLQLFVGADIKKPMASAPLSYYGQGIGAEAFGAGDALQISIGAATALNLNYATAGAVQPENQRRWNLPVEIPSDTAMYGQVSTPAGKTDVTQDFRLRVYMDGLKRRPVA